MVKGIDNEWFNNIDLRVDDSKEPFSDLHRLLRYHYGRIRLNQATMAIRMGNIQKGKMLLDSARKMVKGWNGLQGKVALALLLLHEKAEAITVIRAALKLDEANKELQQATGLDPANEEAVILLRKQFPDIYRPVLFPQ